MTKKQQKEIENIVIMDFETGHISFEDIYEFRSESGFGKNNDDLYNYYCELRECGPYDIIERLGRKRFSEDYLEEFGV